MSTGETVRVMLTGDNVVFSSHPRPVACYEKVAPTLKQADIRFGNLEWPLTTDAPLDPLKEAAYKAMGAAARASNSTFSGSRMDVGCVDALRFAGYNVVGLANNHHMDFGAAGSAQTRKALKGAGIAFCGAGQNVTEARRPAILEHNGVRVAFLAFTSVFLPNYAATPERPGMATVKVHTSYAPPSRFDEQPGTPMETKTMPDPPQQEAQLQAVKDAKQQADAVICSIHWGVSKGNTDSGLLRRRVSYQMQLGRACIDAGASLVVGHHPHVLQGVESYKQGVICYSLGNFVFARGTGVPSGFPPESVIADCSFTKTGLRELSFFPVLVNKDDQPEVVDLETGRAVLATLEEDSRALGTTFTPRDGKIYLDSRG